MKWLRFAAEKVSYRKKENFIELDVPVLYYRSAVVVKYKGQYEPKYWVDGRLKIQSLKNRKTRIAYNRMSLKRTNITPIAPIFFLSIRTLYNISAYTEISVKVYERELPYLSIVKL